MAAPLRADRRHLSSAWDAAIVKRFIASVLLPVAACSGDSETTAFIQLPSEVSPNDAQNHVEAACRLLVGRDLDLEGAAAEAVEAVRLDEKWTVFYLAVTDSSDGTQDWFDVGTDERVMNLTCSGGLPNDSADLEVKLRRPLSEFKRP